MPIDAPRIEIDQLSKKFGAVDAVSDLTFEVEPGRVTGFLGPNGAGKTTTLRMLLGLTTASSGSATLGGRRYVDYDRPAAVAGAALEASSFHPGRSGLGHLEVYAPQAGVDRARCRELIEFVGLAPAGDRRVGGYSLGMRQRLALATALLADPPVLVLDEPANGLDPEGIAWLRGLLRSFAAEGRTVLVSSHVLSEVQSTVDDVVIIAQGRLVHASSLPELAALANPSTYVESPDLPQLAVEADRHGWTHRPDGHGMLLSDVAARDVGAAAHQIGLELHQLASKQAGLEDLFLRLTAPTDDAATVNAADAAPTTRDGAA